MLHQKILFIYLQNVRELNVENNKFIVKKSDIGIETTQPSSATITNV